MADTSSTLRDGRRECLWTGRPGLFQLQGDLCFRRSSVVFVPAVEHRTSSLYNLYRVLEGSWEFAQTVNFNSVYLYSTNSQHRSSQGSSQKSGSYIPINPNH
ncbi:hypothetical protein AMECASPLE_039762 [Ameca splendens]|uniref:Uncharacterized protein n=1 Tax=Ameca splendens TaxID=208324 RepID=A0ABV0ZU74_9TELE